MPGFLLQHEEVEGNAGWVAEVDELPGCLSHSLHAELAREAEMEGVNLNSLITTTLARSAVDAPPGTADPDRAQGGNRAATCCPENGRTPGTSRAIPRPYLAATSTE